MLNFLRILNSYENNFIFKENKKKLGKRGLPTYKTKFKIFYKFLYFYILKFDKIMVKVRTI